MKVQPNPERQALASAPDTPPALLEELSQDQTLAGVLAQNPACPPELLERLSCRSRRLARLVVQNPNTPKALLFRLGVKYPKELLQNPLLLLVTLEDPGFWASASDDFLESLCAREDAPIEAICQSLAGSISTRLSRLRLLLAGHPRTPTFMLEQLAGDWDPSVRWKASKNPNTPEALRPAAQAELLYSHQMTEQTLDAKLYQQEVPPLTPPELRRLALAGPWCRYIAASHPDTPMDVLEGLLTDPDAQVVDAAVSHPSQAPETLHRLLENKGVLHAIAKNPGASSETLQNLWRSLPKPPTSYPASNITNRLALNPSTPKEILREIFGFHEEGYGFLGLGDGVLECLAQNPSCPLELLLALEEALPHLIAANPSIPKEMLSRFVSSPNASLRAAAAKNPSLCGKDIEKLSSDAAEEVRAQVATRLDLPAPIFRRLMLDPSVLVKKNILKAKERKRRSFTRGR